MARLIFAALNLCLLSPLVVAEAINPALTDKFSFKGGVLYQKTDATLTVARAPLPETPVSLNFLGIDDEAYNPWLAFSWRFREKWALSFLFNRFDESGGAITATDFNFDGDVYPAGTAIESDLRADAYVFDLSYAFWKADNYEAGLGFGLHAFDLKAGIKGEVVLGPEQGRFQSSTEDLIAPVPNLRLFGTYAFNAKTSVRTNAGWLSLTYGDYEGDFLYLAAQVEYRFTDRFGAGLGYQYTDIDVEHDSGGRDFEKFVWDFNSVNAYLTYSF